MPSYPSPPVALRKGGPRERGRTHATVGNVTDVAEKMIKSPRNIKYTKYQKNYTHSRGTPAKRSTSVDFGAYGLQCNEPTLLSLKQLETCRRTLRRVVARRAPI